MAKKTYVGVGSKARAVKDIYIGVEGKARRVLKAYVGDANGKAKEVYLACHRMTNTSTAATCQTCSLCDYKDTTHTMVNTGTAGVHQTCSTCGYYTTTHSYTVDSGEKYSDATCQAAQKNYAKCTCGYYPKSSSHLVSVGNKNTNNHTSITTLAAVAATCTATGLTEGKKCTACGVTTVAQTTVAKNSSNHTGSAQITNDTTNVHSKYSCCGATYSTSHTYDQSKATSTYLKSSANCMSAAVYYKSCACGYYTTSNPTFTSGSKNASNHISGCTVVNASTANVCKKYSQCGATYDSTHNMQNTSTSATCQTCKDCGYKDTSHTYNTGVITTAATCSATGVKTYTCSTCGHSYTETVAKNASNHSNKTSYTAKAPTCTADGYYAYSYCSGCQKYYNSSGTETTWANIKRSATGHTPGAAATCTTAQTCTVCSATITAATGHSKTSYSAVAPTCTTAGNYAYSYCSKCSTYWNASGTATTWSSIYRAATGHTAGAAATCSSTQTCTVCGTQLAAKNPSNHSSKTSYAAKSPTCTASGNYAYSYCSGCQKYYNSSGTETTWSSIYRAATGHTNGASVQENYTAATCIVNGGYDTVMYCIKCNTETSRVHTTLNAPGHSVETMPAVAATCTQTGLTSGQKCTVCNTITKAQTTVAATGHSKLSYGATAPTCTTAGNYAYSQCVKCSAYFNSSGTETTWSSIYRAATGHSKTSYSAVAPTCTASGNYAYSYCSKCSTYWNSSGTETTWSSINRAALGHNQNTTISGYAATCTATGKTDGKKCSRCGEVQVAQQTIEALGHNYQLTASAITATCQSTGKTAKYTCSRCTASYGGETVAINSNNHEGTIVDGGTAAAHKAYDCCGKVTQGSSYHSYNSTVTQSATCTSTGTKLYYCSCGYDYTETIPTTSHSKVYHAAFSATCTTSGNKAYYTCNNCSTYFDSSGNVTTWTSIQTAPTGHSKTSYSAKEPTCTADGYYAYSYCYKCYTYFDSNGFVTTWSALRRKALGHTTNSGICNRCKQTVGGECVIETTAILMADGTEKPISEVQTGDMVKSWDLDNNEYIDVKVLGALCTGEAADWTTHTFDNGQSVTVYNNHRIFCKENNGVKGSDEWRAGLTALALDGTEIKYEEAETRHDETVSKRYTMLTENNLYFANGILCGHHSKSKYNFFTKGYIETPSSDDLLQFMVTHVVYDEMEKAFTNEEYLKLATPLREKLLKAKEDIRVHRHEIKKIDRDIKKRGRNRIDQKELFDIDDRRNGRVADARRMKADAKTIRRELDELKVRFGITTKSKYEIWKETYDLDMAYIKSKR